MIYSNKNKLCNLFFYSFLMLGLFTACEDPIEVPSDFEESQFVVDAWLTNLSEPQTILLSQSLDYFVGGQAPTVSGANIEVCNNQLETCYLFVEVAQGKYVWTPTEGQSLGKVGDDFTLNIELDNERFTSNTDLSRTARIDSISLELEEESLIFEEGLYAELFAFDSIGSGDTYWIRAYKNDTLLNRPEENTVVFDAAFDAGTDVDGTYFWTPIRGSINPLNDDGDFIPYQIGDEIYVEIHSINEPAFQFLVMALEQITNEGIFAEPLANSTGNVVNTLTGERVLGIFNIAEVTSLRTVVE